MSLEIRVRGHRGAILVALDGWTDARWLEPMRGALGAAMDDTELLVLEVDGLFLTESDALRRLLNDLLEAQLLGRIRVAIRSLSSIGPVAGGRIDQIVPVHPSVDEAVTAHLGAATDGKR